MRGPSPWFAARPGLGDGRPSQGGALGVELQRAHDLQNAHSASEYIVRSASTKLCVLAFFYGVFAAVALTPVVFDLPRDEADLSPTVQVLSGVLLLASAAAAYVAAFAAAQLSDRKAVGTVVAVGSLAFFPVGTLLGAAILSALWRTKHRFVTGDEYREALATLNEKHTLPIKGLVAALAGTAMAWALILVALSSN
jgi:hypothetical protein